METRHINCHDLEPTILQVPNIVPTRMQSTITTARTPDVVNIFDGEMAHCTQLLDQRAADFHDGPRTRDGNNRYHEPRRVAKRKAKLAKASKKRNRK